MLSCCCKRPWSVLYAAVGTSMLLPQRPSRLVHLQQQRRGHLPRRALAGQTNQGSVPTDTVVSRLDIIYVRGHKSMLTLLDSTLRMSRTLFSLQNPAGYYRKELRGVASLRGAMCQGSLQHKRFGVGPLCGKDLVDKPL